MSKPLIVALRGRIIQIIIQISMFLFYNYNVLMCKKNSDPPLFFPAAALLCELSGRLWYRLF